MSSNNSNVVDEPHPAALIVENRQTALNNNNDEDVTSSTSTTVNVVPSTATVIIAATAIQEGNGDEVEDDRDSIPPAPSTPRAGTDSAPVSVRGVPTGLPNNNNNNARRDSVVGAGFANNNNNAAHDGHSRSPSDRSASSSIAAAAAAVGAAVDSSRNAAQQPQQLSSATATTLRNFNPTRKQSAAAVNSSTTMPPAAGFVFEEFEGASPVVQAPLMPTSTTNHHGGNNDNNHNNNATAARRMSRASVPAGQQQQQNFPSSTNRKSSVVDSSGGILAASNGINRSRSSSRRSESPARATPVENNNHNEFSLLPIANATNNNIIEIDEKGGGGAGGADSLLVVVVPGTSQKHLFDDDAEYDEALRQYDADVLSSEAANRFAVGIHSSAASATRHFADACELAIEEVNRHADRRNKTAETIRQMIRVEQNKYGFAGVAEELGQLTGVLIEDHRRRIELLSDRVRLQLKSTLSQILREQEHAGEALRAEVIKTASMEFAQESLRGLIGMSESRKQLQQQQQQQQASSITIGGGATAAATSASLNLKLRADEPSASEKGNKAATDVYVNELEQRLAALFSKHTSFILPKAQTIVGNARGTFERMADHLAKIEDENIRRLQRQVDITRKHIHDLEDTAANLGRVRVTEAVQLESDLGSKQSELKRIRDHRQQLQDEVKQREERIAERRKASYGVSVGGLLLGSATGGYGLPGEYSSQRSPRGLLSSSSGVIIGGSAGVGIGGGIGEAPRTRAQKEQAQLEKERRLNAVNARSQAMAEKQAARLQDHRDRAQADVSAQRAKTMKYGTTSRGGSTSAPGSQPRHKQQQQQLSSRYPGAVPGAGRRSTGAYSLLTHECGDDCRHKSPERHQSECPNDMFVRDDEKIYNASRDKQQQQQQGQGSIGGVASPSTLLSRRNLGPYDQTMLPAEERTRKHLDSTFGVGGDASVETREVDPKEGIVTRRRTAAHRGGEASGSGSSPPSGGLQQNLWIESAELKKITERTARHGLSFPDGTDPVIPTHKFLDDELSAIYELRHLRSPGGNTARK